MAFQIGSPSGNILEINVDNEAKVALTTDTLKAGYAIALGERDDGTVLGTPQRAPFEVSADYRMRAGIDTMVASWQFVGTAVDTTSWTYPATTMTLAVANGFVTINNGAVFGLNNVIQLSSRRAFPAWGSFTLWGEFNVQFVENPQPNNVCEWGFFIATGTATPTDGCFFRLNALGEFRAVVNLNGTEIQSGSLDFAGLVGAGNTRTFLIGVHNDSVTFWINDVMVYSHDLAPAAASIVSTQALPVAFRNYYPIAGSAPGQQMKIGAANVTLGEYHGTKFHSHIMSGFGGGGYQGQPGGTIGSTSNVTNQTGGALPAAAVPTNTTAALGSGLGGIYYETDTLAQNTDGIICSFQVPALATNAVNKSLYVTGVRIMTFIQTALVGGGYSSIWQICFGHTAVSLATTETSTSKAPRREAIGTHTVPAAAATTTVLPVVEVTFDTPRLVQPGEFFQVVERRIGTTPGSGTKVHVIDIDAYWE